MKIVHIITGLNSGGAEASLFRLITNDAKNTHTVISMIDEGKYGKPLQERGIIVHCLNMSRGEVNYQALRKLWKLIKEIKPDVIQTWMYHADLVGGTLAKLQGIKNINWCIRQSDLSSKKNSVSTRLAAHLCALLSYIIPKNIISCAQKATETHRRIGYAKNKFITIPNGYKFDKRYPNHEKNLQLRSQFNLSDSDLVIGMIARFNPQKDHRNLINALGKLKATNIQLKCLLVGKGMSADNNELTRLIEQDSLVKQVILLEQRDDIPTIMNMLDIHVLSSIGEGFPNVLAEAMICGTPCVTTNVGDATLIVGDTGWVVPPSDSQVLADAILTAIQEKEKKPAAWHTRKQAAKQRIMDNFSIERMVSAYNQVWQGRNN